jgi:hypothetical protein
MAASCFRIGTRSRHKSFSASLSASLKFKSLPHLQRHPRHPGVRSQGSLMKFVPAPAQILQRISENSGKIPISLNLGISCAAGRLLMSQGPSPRCFFPIRARRKRRPRQRWRSGLRWRGSVYTGRTIATGVPGTASPQGVAAAASYGFRALREQVCCPAVQLRQHVEKPAKAIRTHTKVAQATSGTGSEA